MAGGIDLGGSGARGGKKPLDVAINLVPFIDLMAVTISFLIITAVWTNVGRLEVAPKGEGAADATEQQPLTVHVTDRGIEVNAMPVTVEALEQKLIDAKAPAQTSVTVRADDGVRYEALVHVIDDCIAAGLPNVSVEPAS